jgi:hypothetical protein
MSIIRILYRTQNAVHGILGTSLSCAEPLRGTLNIQHLDTPSQSCRGNHKSHKMTHDI